MLGVVSSGSQPGGQGVREDGRAHRGQTFSTGVLSRWYQATPTKIVCKSPCNTDSEIVAM